MKSFSKQLADLFSYAGYKSNAKLLPCSISSLPSRTHPHLTYKCDIALRIYEHYKKHGFKFSEQGVTPITIAEEIMVYVFKSKDYEMEVDSFGYLLARPTREYVRRLEERIFRDGKVRHEGIVVDGLQESTWNRHGKKIFFGHYSPLNLSTLRMAYYQALLKRKTIAFQEKSIQNAITIADLHSLSHEGIEILLENGIIDYSTFTLNLQSTLTTKFPFPSLHNTKTLDLGPKDEVITFALRHELIPFQQKYKHTFNSNTKILTFGDVFPTISAKQAKNAFPQAIKSIFLHTLSYKTESPIDLRKSTEPYKPVNLLQQLQSRSSQQKLLILLDAIYQDQLLDLLSLKNSQPLTYSPDKPLQILLDQLHSIL